MNNLVLSFLTISFLTGFRPILLRGAEPPKVGDKAPDFTLKTLDNQTVRLHDLTSKGTVVLVVLRGWPGYQCPICERQVEDFIASASKFDAVNAHVIMVYPGPAENLKAHAKEFLEMRGKQWPKDFTYVLDPDYTMVNAYGLRWDAPRETAYPSTFILDKKGIVRFEKISHSHGDRSKATEVLDRLKDLTAAISQSLEPGGGPLTNAPYLTRALARD